MNTSKRKDEHIRINLEENVTFEQVHSGLADYHFIHQALPNLDLEAVESSVTFLGRQLTFPLLIASMTGGSEQAARLNRTLAEAAQAAGIGMGLGSMRAALEDPEIAWTYQVRRYAPDILLLANLGAVQLNYGYGPEECRRAVALVEADGLYLHLNPLQEALQPEGNTRFANLLQRIEMVCRALDPIPVIIKEVGFGLSGEAAQQLHNAGVAALEIAGAGGTTWSQVEMHRSQTYAQREVAAIFREWGIPTALSLTLVRQAVSTLPLIASGGLRSGLDIAKALALGADVATIAGPLLKAAAQSPESLQELIEIYRRQFRISMFGAGVATIAALKTAPLFQLK